MEIESFWKGLPGWKNNEKGNNGHINYGYWKKHGRETPSPHCTRNRRRKCYRQIRKYGFDFSELWGLDYTFMRWLSDEFGGFFKICGASDDWSDYDFEGRYYSFEERWADKNENLQKKLWEAEYKRHESFKFHLEDFFNNISQETCKDVAAFISPRLRMLAKITNGWPGGEEVKTFDDWVIMLNDMADQFEQGKCSPFFIKYFFGLWD